jgi:selenocysteine lyase/cysteine desulfurase
VDETGRPGEQRDHAALTYGSYLALDELRRSPNALARHYTRFDVGGERVLLSGHSHQAWPDVAEEGLLECFADAAAAVDGKWERAEVKAQEVRAGYRRLLEDPSGEIALGPNTHDLIIKLLSALDLRGRTRVVTTDGEFHSLRRQLDRLAEEGLDVRRVPAEPVATLAERLAAEVDDKTLLVGVSAVMFMTSRVVPDLAALAPVCARHGAELLVDAYHTLGPVPFPIHELGLEHAWITGGGYKYLQLGEGNAFLRLPPHGHDVRPVVTGWFAEFDELTGHHDQPDAVTYGPGALRFASGTYDPVSSYRGARVFRFFDEQGLTPAFLHEAYQHQLGVLTASFDGLDLPAGIISRDHDAAVADLGGFLSLRAPRAGDVQQALLARGVLTDSRADRLRVGPAPYLSDDQLHAGMAIIGEVARALG